MMSLASAQTKSATYRPIGTCRLNLMLSKRRPRNSYHKRSSAFVDSRRIDRAKLAAIVFDNPQKLQQLNAIVHPAVKEDFKEWVASHKEHPILVREAAVLFESGTHKDCDYVITVSAPLEVRIERVINRDGSTREQVLKRIKSQWTDEQRAALSDFVIENIDFQQTRQQVNEILKKLKNL